VVFSWYFLHQYFKHILLSINYRQWIRQKL
jgi:hypothetical protein